MADINEFDSLMTNRDESGLSISEKLERLVPLVKGMFADSISQHITEQAVTNLLSDERIQTNSDITAAIATAAAQGKQQAIDEIMGGEVSASLNTIREIATEVTDIDGLLSGVISDLASKATITALQAVAADVTNLQAAILTKASTTHNHDTAYLGKTATAANSLKLGNQLPEYYAPASAATGRTASAIVDWNDAINNGVYMGQDAAHAPGSGWWIGEVFRHADTWLTQRVWDFNGQRKVYARFNNGGTWSAWTQITAANFKVWHPDNVHDNFDLINGLFGGKLPSLYALKSDLPAAPTGPSYDIIADFDCASETLVSWATDYDQYAYYLIVFRDVGPVGTLYFEGSSDNGISYHASQYSQSTSSSPGNRLHGYITMMSGDSATIIRRYLSVTDGGTNTTASLQMNNWSRPTHFRFRASGNFGTTGHITVYGVRTS